MNKKSTLRQIIVFIKPYKLLLVLDFIIAIFYVAATLLTPVFTGNAIDFIIDKNNVDQQKVLNYLFLLLITTILGAIFGWVMNYITNYISYSVCKDIRQQTFNKLLKVPVSYLDQNMHGDLLTRSINDVEQICQGLLQGFSQLFTGVITILTTLIFMIVINYKIALIVLLLTPISFLVASFIAKGSHKSIKEQAKIKGEMGSLINEMIENQKIVLAYNYQEENINRFKEINEELYKWGFKSQFYGALINPSTRFVNALVYATVGVFGAISAVSGTISVGKLYIFLQYASQYTKPFNEISGVISELQVSLASARRVLELLKAEEEKDETNLPSFKGENHSMTIENLYFSYTPNQKLIQNLNININDDSLVAIVGPTGCGKTTLINLIMRFYAPNSGKILISNQDISTFSKNSLRDNIGMVLQDIWLFKGTVYENIAYGKKDATKEEIIEAAKKAHAHNFIKNLPNQYETIISDDEGISLGQKQLICIARLFLKLPPMLILDEATSNIDTRTEIIIQKTFKELMKGRTCFVIAHRLSTIKEADVILVMKDGNIVEIGNHQSLLEKNGFYATLYKSQF